MEILRTWLVVDICFALDNFSLSQGSDFSGKSYRQVLVPYWGRCLDWVFYRAGLANGLCLKMACLGGGGDSGSVSGRGFRPFEL